MSEADVNETDSINRNKVEYTMPKPPENAFSSGLGILQCPSRTVLYDEQELMRIYE